MKDKLKKLRNHIQSQLDLLQTLEGLDKLAGEEALDILDNLARSAERARKLANLLSDDIWEDEEKWEDVEVEDES